MEIKFDNVIYKDKTINFMVREYGIYSFLGSSNSIKNIIFKYLNKELKSDNVHIKNCKVGIASNNVLKSTSSVRNVLQRVLEKNNYKLSTSNSRIHFSLKLVNLDEKYLDYKVNDLNYIESKKVSLACALIHNPRIIILEDYTIILNHEDRKELLRLLKMLKNKYKKTIVLLTKDTTFSYEVADYIYLLSDTTIVKEGDKSILYETNILNKLNLEIPPIIKFILECRKNGHDIGEYNNILDLIKAIYRNVE